MRGIRVMGRGMDWMVRGTKGSSTSGWRSSRLVERVDVESEG